MKPWNARPLPCCNPAIRLALRISLLLFGTAAALAAQGRPCPEEQVLSVLKQVRDEVREMGSYPGEDFVRREFFVGEDDDDTNKDIHVNILIQALKSGEKMTLRVTEMAVDPGNPRARLARASKLVVCLFAGDRLEIKSSDYEDKELSRLAPEILTAIRNKKRLLKSGTPHPIAGLASPF